MIQIHNGYCLVEMDKLIEQGVQFDAIITDPPYGTTACKWDSVIPFDAMWERLNKLIKPNGAVVLFGSEPFSSALRMSNIKNYRYDWIWESNRAANFAQAPYMPLKNTETISVFSFATIAANSKNRMIYNPEGTFEVDKICSGKTANAHRPNRADQKPYRQTRSGYPTQIIKFAKESSPVHPTQKPVALMEYLIRTYTNENETVLDFTMGSGSTGVACINTNRNFIGIDKDKEYYVIAYNRLKEAKSKIKPALL